LHILCIVPTD